MARRIWKYALIFATSMAVFACSDVDYRLFEPTRVKSQSDAGSIHLAVAPPIPFADVREALTPGFNLTGDQAVAKAIPNTAYIEDRFFEMFSAAIGVGLPRTSVTGTKADGDKTVAKAPDRFLADTGKGVLSTGDEKRPLKQDAMLQYAAGTALFQEVHLLERYVAFASQRHGYKPFVVRMNIGVQPFARGQPYDIYSSIGFFVEDAKCEAKPAAHPNRRQPYVLPLLVTDNLEGITSARSAEMITQIALAVSVLAQGIAGDASFGYTRDRLKSVLGTDLNSLLTVGRSSDNVIAVRLGAASQPTTRYAMVPRNHTVTALMLVPNEQFVLCPELEHAPLVRTTMKTGLRDAETGQLVPFDRVGLRTSLLPTLLRTGVPEITAKDWIERFPSELDELLYLVRVQNREKFDDLILKWEPSRQPIKPRPTEPLYTFASRGPRGGEIYRDGLWVALSEFQSRAEFQLAVITLCDPDNRRSRFGCAPPPVVKRPPPETPKPDPAKVPPGATINITIPGQAK
jgi:hypothetical protein